MKQNIMKMDICLSCYLEHIKKNKNEIFRGEIAAEFFLNQWKHGTCICMPAGSLVNTFRHIHNPIPKECPYELELVLAGQSDV